MVSSHAWGEEHRRLKGPLQISGALSSLLLSPGDSHLLGLPRFLALPPRLSGTLKLCLGSPPRAVAWTPSPGSKLGHLEGPFHLFPFLRNHCIVLPVAQCLKTVVLCIFLFVLVFGGFLFLLLL